MVIQSSMSRVVNSTKSGFQHYALKSPLSDHCAAHHPLPQTAESEDRMTVDDALKVATMRDVALWKMAHARAAAGISGATTPDALRAEALDVLAGEVERLRAIVECIRYELAASEPRPERGQSCGPRAEAWVMTPTTRRNLRRLLDTDIPQAELAAVRAALEGKWDT
jgi:hypothetical protein